VLHNDKFIFTIESVGALDVSDIFKIAIDTLTDKFNKIISKIKEVVINQ